MLITCSSCNSKYLVNSADLQPAGMTVRCAKCENEWFQNINIDDIKKLKKICPNIPFLVPGIGSQGGDLKSVINVLKQDNIDTSPYIINSSRSILYASNKLEFESAARIEADKFVNLVKPLIF